MMQSPNDSADTGEKADLQLSCEFSYLERLCEDNMIGTALYRCPDFTLLKANHIFVEIMARYTERRNNITGLRVDEFIPEWDKHPEKNIWMNVIKTGKTYKQKEYKYCMPDGTAEYYDYTLMPINENGRVGYIAVMLYNTTESVLAKKRIEEQVKTIEQQKRQCELIKQQNELLETVMENMSDALYIYNKNGYCIKMNREAREFFLKPIDVKGDIYSMGKRKLYDLDGKEILVENTPTYRVLKGERIKEEVVEIRTPEGEMYIGISGVPVFDGNGDLYMAVMTGRDVTEDIRQTQIISQQKQQLDTIIENVSDALFILDGDGNYIKLNKAAREQFSMSYKTLDKLGDGYRQTEYYNDRGEYIPFENIPASRVLRGERINGERMTVRFPDRIMYMDVSGVPIYDGQGELNMGILCCRDITEQVKHHEMLLSTEKEKKEALKKVIKMKDEFLYTISHEFKTPLTVITSAIQAMELICRNELTEKAKGFIAKIRQNTLRQLRLVNNLLDITVIESGYVKIRKKNFDIVHLTRTITESVLVYSSQKDVDVSFASEIEKRIVGMDEEKYERILLNLLSNAIKFTPRGRRVLVEIMQKNRKVHISIADEGIGIPEDKQDIIFERFGQVDSSLTRQAEGTGIGLSLVKLLVNALGGEISLRSQVGRGSTFTLSFPVMRVVEKTGEKVLREESDGRLIYSTAIEFSDIYLS